MIEIRPIVQATGPNNPARQISVTNWNIGHALTAAPMSLIGTDGTGVATEYAIEDFALDADLDAGLDLKVNRAGDTMTGPLTVGGTVAVKPLDGIKNSNLLFWNFAQLNRGLLYWDFNTDSMKLRKFGADGIVIESELVLASTAIAMRLGVVDKLTVTAAGATVAGQLTVTDEAYGPSWDGSTAVPTKNAVYDKVQSLATPVVVWGTITGTLSNQTDLQTALNGKSNVGHTHVIADTTGLQAALDAKVDDSEMGAYATDAELAAGLANYVPLTQKGAVSGVATLDGGGKVPSTQLPSYVDDVIEVANYAALPVTGETGKIYITLDDNNQYRWSGSVYVDVTPGGAAVWGAITGTLSNQTDLNTALNARVLKAGDTMTGGLTISAPAATLTINPTTSLSTFDMKGSNGGNDGLHLQAMGQGAYYGADTHYFRTKGTATMLATLNTTNLTMTVPVVVPADPYAAGWNGSLQVPTKDAIYDKIESVVAGIPPAVDITGKVSKAGDTMSGNLTFASADALFYSGAVHSGTIEGITEDLNVYSVTGNLELDGATGVNLAHANVWKLKTKTTGIDVLGDVDVDSGDVTVTDGSVICGVNTLAAFSATFGNSGNPGFLQFTSSVNGGTIQGPTASYAGFKLTAGEYSFQNVAGSVEFAKINSTGVVTAAVTSTGNLTLSAAGATGDLLLRTNFGTVLTIDQDALSTFAGKVVFADPVTAAASIRLPHGTAPTTLANGDMWTTTAGLFVRVNGATVGPLGAGGGGAVDDTPYGASWDGVTTIAPSKNAVYDKIEALSVGGGGVTTFNTRSGAVTLTAADVSAAGANAFVATGAISGSNLSGTNTGDQTSIAGITGTKAQFNTALTDDDFAYVNTANTFVGIQTVNGAANANGTVNISPSGTAIYSQINMKGNGGTQTNGYSILVGNSTVYYNVDNYVFRSAASVIWATLGSPGFALNVPMTVPADAYAAGWNGSTQVPTKDAVYDKVELLATDIAGKANTSALAGYLPLTGGALSGDLAINKASPQLTLNPSSGGAVLELLGAGGVDGFRLQAIAATGNVRSDTVNITNKANSATYASFASGAITLNGKITNAATQGSVLTGVDQLQLREPGLSAGYTFKMGYLNAVGGNGWQGAIDVLQGGVGGFLTLNPSGGTVVSGGPLNVPDDAYGLGWNGSLQVPTKDAVYDKIELLATDIAGKANTSALANYVAKAGDTMTGTLTVPTVVMPTFGASKVRLFSLGNLSVPLWGAFSLNANYASGWFLDDTTKDGWYFNMDARASAGNTNGLYVFQVPAGAGDRTAAQLTKFGVMPTYVHVADAQAIGYGGATVTPPSGSHKLDVNGTAKFVGAVTVPAEAYGATWAAKLEAPTKKDVYDKIEAITVGGGGVTSFNTRTGAVTLTAADVSAAGANAFTVGGLLTLTGPTGTVLQVGNVTPVGSATPAKLTLGASYSTVAGANPKIEVFSDGTDKHGFGVSAGRLDYMVPTGCIHTYYVAGTKVAELSSTVFNLSAGLSFTVAGAAMATVSQLANYLPLTGGTVTGSLTIGGASGGIYFNDRDGSGTPFILYNQSDGFRLYNGGDVVTVDTVGNMSLVGSGGLLWCKGVDAQVTILSKGSVGTFAAANAGAGMEVRSSDATGGTTGAWLAFHRPSATAMHIGLDVDNLFKIGGWSWSYSIPPMTLSSAGVMKLAGTQLHLLGAGQSEIQCGPAGAYGIMYMSSANAGFYKASGSHMYQEMAANGKLVCSGRITAAGTHVFRHQSGTYSSSDITYSTSAPSGGADGDMWLQYV